jgi:hypothetical protein
MRLEKCGSARNSGSNSGVYGFDCANLWAIWIVQWIGPSSAVGDDVRASALTSSSDIVISWPGAGAKPIKRPTSIESPGRATDMI